MISPLARPMRPSRPTRTAANGRDLWLALAIIAVAAVVRGVGVGLADFRGDEAFSIRLAGLPLNTLFAAMAASEPNPPLQFLFLRGWVGALGLGEAVVRWPSVLSGVLAVAVAYRLAVALIGRRVALVATTWMAVQPFLIWYSEDLRAYTSLSLWHLVAAWCAWQGLRAGRWPWWIASAAAAWLAMALHYFAVLPLVALALAVIVSPDFGRSRWRAGASYAAAAALYAPWALYVWPLLSGHEKSWLTPLSAADVAWRTLVAYSTGGHWAGAADGWLLPGVVVLGALMALGLMAAWRDRQRLVWLLALGPATPALLGLLNAWRPTYAEHYALPGLAGCLMLAALGLDRALVQTLPRRVATIATWVALISIGLVSLACVNNVWFDPAYAKSPGWKALANALAARVGPNDVVWANRPDPALEVYLAGRVPLENAPPLAIPAIGTSSDAEHASALQAAIDQLQTAQRENRRVFFLPAPGPGWDPDGVAGNNLLACCELLDEQVAGGQRFQIFDTPGRSLAARQPLDAGFEPGMRLTGYRLDRIADRLHLTLFWRADALIGADYTVFVHLKAADGFQAAGADGDPRGGAAPTSSWTLNTDVIDPHPIVIPPALVAGSYSIEFGWYKRSTGERISLLTGGDSLRLPDVLTIP